MSSGTGVITNGIGRKTTAHLNLTVTMADKPMPRKQSSSRKKDRPNAHKIPYAGREQA